MSAAPGAATVDIAPMTAADLEQVLNVERHAFRRPSTRDLFLEELAREWAHVDVLREAPGSTDARIVAYVNYWLVRDEVHILNVATHIDARRRGHAHRLLDHVIAFARRHGCRYVTLEVRRSNDGAIRLYRAHGFRPVGVRPNYYAEENEDAIVMLLELA